VTPTAAVSATATPTAMVVAFEIAAPLSMSLYLPMMMK
jgi:hypothetical protein